MSLIITGRRGASVVSGVPGQASNVLLLMDGQPGTAYSICPHASSGASQVTQVEGLLSPSGIIGVQPRFQLSNSPIDAQSCRVDYFNVPPSAQTAQMRFRNANGPGLYSASPSNSVTPIAYSDTWLDGHNAVFPFCGGSQVGINTALWNLTFFDFQTLPLRTVAPGTSTSTNPNFNSSIHPTVNAPAYPTGANMTNQQMLEVLPSGDNAGFGFLCAIYLQNAPGATTFNGLFNANPFSRLCCFIFPTTAGGGYTAGGETIYAVEGVVSTVTPSGGNIVHAYANQDFTTNTWSPVSGSIGIVDRTVGDETNWISNTATAITSASITMNPGDVTYTAVGDQATGNQVDITQFVVGTWTINAWNRLEIPLGILGLNLLAFNNGMHYKSGINMPGGTSKGAAWICDYAFVV